MRQRKEKRSKHVKKNSNDTNDDTVTGDPGDVAQSCEGLVPTPTAEDVLDRHSKDGDKIMSNVFSERCINNSNMPNIGEYIDQDPNEYSDIRVKCFNAEGLSKELKSRAYEHIMEKNTIVMVVDTRITDEKLLSIKQLAE